VILELALQLSPSVRLPVKRGQHNSGRSQCCETSRLANRVEFIVQERRKPNP